MTKENEQSLDMPRLVDTYLGNNYNPDVLSCLANLSNDEVFTPPDVANRMLDMLPQELFEDPDTTFLDPCCKSGVFLREIAKRLVKGLEKKIPDLHKRTENIFMRQLFGIAITELTSLVSRRTLYCSKYPNCEYSIVPFESSEGNIRFRSVQHTWCNGRCLFCGASESEYGKGKRDNTKENFAYELIHSEKPQRIYDMKFDVIIGNPPYQISDGGAAASATPLYHNFVEKAKQLNPRYLSFIIPARWYSGGKGLDSFRDSMLSDTKIRELYDFQNASVCFPNVEIKGGVCYFLWDREYDGPCKIVNCKSNGEITTLSRYLREKNCSTFIRFNEAVSILRKVRKFHEESFASLVSARKPFGLATNYRGKKEQLENSIILFENSGTSYISRDNIPKGQELVDKYKVYITMAYGAGEVFPHQILNKPFIGEKGTCCTETYLVIGPFETKKIASNVISYIKTLFFRFLVLLIKNTQHATSKVYEFVPVQDFSHEWTDEELYKKYNLNKDEIAFIESMIRPMDLA